MAPAQHQSRKGAWDALLHTLVQAGCWPVHEQRDRPARALSRRLFPVPGLKPAAGECRRAEAPASRRGPAALGQHTGRRMPLASLLQRRPETRALLSWVFCLLVCLVGWVFVHQCSTKCSGRGAGESPQIRPGLGRVRPPRCGHCSAGFVPAPPASPAPAYPRGTAASPGAACLTAPGPHKGQATGTRAARGAGNRELLTERGTDPLPRPRCPELAQGCGHLGAGRCPGARCPVPAALGEPSGQGGAHARPPRQPQVSWAEAELGG